MQDLEPGQPARPMLAVASKSVEYAHTKLNGRPAIVETKFDGERMQVPLTYGCVRSSVHRLSTICEGVLRSELCSSGLCRHCIHQKLPCADHKLG